MAIYNTGSDAANTMFRSDLQIWMGKPLREVGPSIRIDANDSQSKIREIKPS